ncbi:MAG TPA: putative Ig domain-containing protein, partial [Vicinamibacterales bacterium]|nr:putative Ig domain-containing protein [Vicinamibacterales bacterium]
EVCTAGTVATTGNSNVMNGTDGNVRDFTANGVNIKASAWARSKSNGAWSAAYLGAFTPGLGVTDNSEGDGTGDKHKIDNVDGSNNYVLFEFSAPVKVTKAYLSYLGVDADATIWIGTKNDPYNNHNTLSDAFLSSLGMTQGVDSDSSTTRWVSFNGDEVSGNVLVIAARPNGTNDAFKLGKVQFEDCPTTGGNTNHAPTIDLADRSNYKKTAVSVQVSGSDQDDDALTYTATGLPTGTSMNAAGLITGTPTTTGTYTVTVTVSDPSNASDSDTFVWTIQNHAPTITTQNITATVGQSGAMQAYGSDLDNDALTYTVTGLPPGVTMNASGLFAGTLTTAGVYTVTITVRDVDNATGFSTFTVTVLQPNRAPIAVNDSASTKKNKAVTVNVLANDSDPDGDALTVTLGSVSNGTLTLNADKTIKFTPKSNYKGAASFTYTISDGKGGTATATVSVNVT